MHPRAKSADVGRRLLVRHCHLASQAGLPRQIKSAYLVSSYTKGKDVHPEIGPAAANQFRGHVIRIAGPIARLKERLLGGDRQAKDEREFEFIDPYYGISYTPGKLNRFLVIPLMAGIQYRLFREDIVDTFRPYINAGAGPAMVYMMPYVQFTELAEGFVQTDQVEFFKSLGKGQPHYTIGGFVGFGANFGTERTNIFGVNFRYYYTHIFGDGLPSLYNSYNRQVSATKNDFGGFVISLNVGIAV